MSDERDNFTQDLQRSMRDSEQGIDDFTLARLRVARNRAVAAQCHAVRRTWTIPVSIAATVTLVVASVLYLQDSAIRSSNVDTALIEDIEMLSNGEAMKLLDDLELYQWLDGHADKSA